MLFRSSWTSAIVKQTSARQICAWHRSLKPAARLSYAEQREREKTLKKAQKRVDDAENEITRLESEIASIEAEISAGNTTPDIFERHANATKALENAMSLWELAGMELEELKQRYS